MRRGRIFPALVGGLLLAAAAAQAIKPENVVELRVEPARVRVAPGGTAKFTLVATIQEGFHTNSNQPTLDYLVATGVELAGEPAFTLEKVQYPAGEMKEFGFAPDQALSVYEGTVRIPVELRAKPEATAGTHTLRLVFRYQACNDQLCLRPTRKEAKLTVEVSPK
ncbi:MAG: protein-disulfide reductase DsbD N-terminal domain-containing protein [Candidatus Acidoferrales bacterium]